MNTQEKRHIALVILGEILLFAASSAAFLYFWIIFSQPLVEKILQQFFEFPTKTVFLLALFLMLGIVLSIVAANTALALTGLGINKQQQSEDR